MLLVPPQLPTHNILGLFVCNVCITQYLTLIWLDLAKRYLYQEKDQAVVLISERIAIMFFWYLSRFLCLLSQAMAEPRTPSIDGKLEEFAAPSHVEEVRDQMVAFAGHHVAAGRKVVLITSGGTKVPLESRTVRFLDNFSSGRRGASSAEYFIESGYAVIFLHRHRSLYPYTRMFSTMNMLEALKFRSEEEASSDCAEVVVNQQVLPNISRVLKKYQEVKENRLLLSVEFNTLSDYLHLLKAAAQALSTIGTF